MKLGHHRRPYLRIARDGKTPCSRPDAMRDQDREECVARLRDVVLHVRTGSALNEVREGSVKRTLKLIAVAMTVAAGMTGLSGCAASPAKSGDDVATVKKAIETANQAFVDASIRESPQGMSAYLADDFVDMNVDGSPDQSKAQYQAYLNKAVPARTYTLAERTFSIDTVEVFGDFAYEVGRNFVVRKSKSNPKAKLDTARSRYITFWRKQPDGTWKAIRDLTVPTPNASR